MKKRLIAVALVLMLLLQYVPAFAEKKYTVEFNILPDESWLEVEFREWASQLVSYYRSERYAALQPGKESFILTPTKFLELKKDAWEISELAMMKEKAQYHPYYWLAQKKAEFDVSVDAHAQNAFGKETRYTMYTDIDLMNNPDKSQEMYMWILSETLKEKMRMEPDFLTSGEYLTAENKGCYVFDVSSGKMVFDKTMSLLDEQSWGIAYADWGKVAVSALDVALKGCVVYGELKQNAANIAKDVAAEYAGQDNSTEKLLDKLKKDLIDTLINTVTATLDKTIDEVRTNFQNEIQNQMREVLAAELANQAIVGNQNVIGYLKTTYVDGVPFGIDKSVNTDVIGFQNAAKSLIAQLDSEAFRSASLTEARNVVKEFAWESMGEEEVLPTEVIIYNVCCEALNTIVSGLVDSLHNLLSGMWDNQLKTAEGKTKEVLSVVKDFVMIDLWNKFVVDGFVKGLRTAAEAHSPQEVNQPTPKNFLQTLGDEMWTGWDVPNLDSFFMSALINRGMEIVGVIAASKEDNLQTNNPQTRYEESAEKLDEHAVMQYLEGDFFGVDNLEIHHLVMAGLLWSVKSSLSSFEAQLKEETSFLNETEKKQLSTYMKELKGAITELEKNPSSKDIKPAIADIMQEVGAFIAWWGGLDSFYEANMWSILLKTGQEMLKPDQLDTTIVNFVGALIKDKSFWEMLISMVFEIDVNKTLKQAEVVLNEFKPLMSSDEGVTVYEETAQAAKQEAMESKANWYLSFFEMASTIWDSATDLANDFWTATNSTANAATGENLVSMHAQRLANVYSNSRALENTLKVATASSLRSAALADGRYDDIEEYDSNLQTFDDGTTEKTYFASFMTAEDILNPQATPNLKNIKNLTDYILMQMNLDAVGMGCYITLIVNRYDFMETRFYEKYINSGILITLQEARERYNNVIDGVSFDKYYKSEWDVLFDD